MQHVKTISKFALLALLSFSCHAKKFDSDDNRFYNGFRYLKPFKVYDNGDKYVLIYKYDVDKNGKLDTIRATIPGMVSINGVNISESSTEDLTPYLANKKLIKGDKDADGNNIYKEEFYEIQLDNQKKYYFNVRLDGMEKHEEWDKEANSRVKFEWSFVGPMEDKYKNFTITTGSNAGSVHRWNHYLKIVNKKLVLTKIIEEAQNYKDCTYRFKKGFKIKMIDTANNLTDKALNRCKEQRLDGY